MGYSEFGWAEQPHFKEFPLKTRALIVVIG
jgi:hypothetical protein